MKINEVFKALWGGVRANVWCLFHPWNHVMTRTEKLPGKLFYETVMVCAGKGSILNESWKTARVFYNRDDK